MPQPIQDYRNHRRFSPLYHYFAFPILLSYAIYATCLAVLAPGGESIALAAFGWGAAVGLLSARVMALTVQDRVIRLEETLRMQRLLAPELQSMIGQLTRRQIIALRFASDVELGDLVRRTVAGELATPQSIKQAIHVWRPDWLRA